MSYVCFKNSDWLGLPPTKAQTLEGRTCLWSGSGWGVAEQREIMALMLERLDLRYPWGIHMDTRVELTIGQEDWRERCGCP